MMDGQKSPRDNVQKLKEMSKGDEITATKLLGHEKIWKMQVTEWEEIWEYDSCGELLKKRKGVQRVGSGPAKATVPLLPTTTTRLKNSIPTKADFRTRHPIRTSLASSRLLISCTCVKAEAQRKAKSCQRHTARSSRQSRILKRSSRLSNTPIHG